MFKQSGMSQRVATVTALALAWFMTLGAAVEQTLGALTLVEEGEPRASLVIPAAPTRGEHAAAQEIQTFVKRMSGATLPIVEPGQPLDGHTPIRIGRAAPGALQQAILAREHSDRPGAFALEVNADGAALRGVIDEDEASANASAHDASEPVTWSGHPQATGTQAAASELLEQLGVRWYMPGELGTVVPERRTITLEEQQIVQVPSFPARQLQSIDAPRWAERLRLGGIYFPASHGIPGVHDNQFEEHPEWFALIDGERRARQLCVSNPEVVQRAIEATKAYFRDHPDTNMIGMGPHDGGGFCECEDCRALDAGDFDPFHHSVSKTDRYVWFFNQVLDGIEDEFPDKRIGFYAYASYKRPPMKWEPDENIVPAVALITLCRIHGPGNPVCPEKSYQQWIFREWGKRVPAVYHRGYFFNLADPGLPFYQMRRMENEIPMGRRLGVAGWRVESMVSWSSTTPSLYVAAKLMWDHEADVDALMDDFYDKFFGPAADPMRTYLQTMDEARYNADYHTGSSWDVPEIYNAEVRKTAREALAKATAQAPEGSDYAARVAMYRKNFEYLQAFVTMLDSRMKHNYGRSMQAMERMNSLYEDLRDHDPPLLHENARSYLNRFYAATTEQAYAKTHEQGEFIAGLDATWQFQIDPEEVGEDIGLWKPEMTGGQWQRMNTRRSWSNEGLRYYKGVAWYRQTVDVPAGAADQRVFLWIGGVDERAEVWLNGQYLGHGSGTFQPWDLNATDAIKPGAENVVAIKAINRSLNELGTGGLTGPVMFYAPSNPEAEPTGNQPDRGELPGVERIGAD